MSTNANGWLAGSPRYSAISRRHSEQAPSYSTVSVLRGQEAGLGIDGKLVMTQKCSPSANRVCQGLQSGNQAASLQACAPSGRLSDMPRRNSPNDIRDLGDLSRLAELVVDKRQGQRAAAKKNRRNRHYEKQFIRNTLAHLPNREAAADPSADSA